jgi:hypothetical protein
MTGPVAELTKNILAYCVFKTIVNGLMANSDKY